MSPLSTRAHDLRLALVDLAHHRRRDGMPSVTIDGRDLGTGHGVDVLVLHATLDRLAVWNSRQAAVAELRLFAGLTIEDVAYTLGVSTATVRRDWAEARHWIRRAWGPTANIAS